MASRKTVSLLRSSLLAICVAAATSIAQAEVFGIDYLSSGGTGTSAFAVSPDGSVVVGRSGYRAFRWTQEKGMQSAQPQRNDKWCSQPTAITPS